MRPPSGIYPGEFAVGGPKAKHYVATGEFRNPRKGEYFLSGAIIIAYLASNDLNNPYWIARPVTLDTCPHCKGAGKVVKL